MIKSTTINCDFDGTVVSHAFPEIGINVGAEFVLQDLVKNGHKLILFTMRCDHDFEPISDQPDIIAQGGPYLTHAIDWFELHNIPLYGIQKDPEQYKWTSSPKSYARYMIDDSALGIPLLFVPQLSSRKFVDWVEMSLLLCEQGLLTKNQYVNNCSDISNYLKRQYDIDYIKINK